MKCPVCDWSLGGPIGKYELAVKEAREEDAPGVSARHGIPIAVFACSNCGYVRLHSANVLEDLKRIGRDGPVADGA
jgi:hypothetical protein